MNNNSAIALFDSGIGGLTVLNALKKLLPNESYIYLGDTARLPYGTKSENTIIKYAIQAASLLAKYDIKLLVIACNTVSAVAIPSLRDKFPDLNIIGVLEPGAELACQKTKNQHIAVIGTESTTKGGAYIRAIHKIKPEIKVDSLACPLFVPLAEEALVEGDIAESVAKYYLEPLFQANDCADTLVLGCTHYPLLAKSIQKSIKKNICLVDSAVATATKVHNLLTSRNLLSQSNQAQLKIITTDDVVRSAKLGSKFLAMDLEAKDIELVDL